LLPVPVVIVEEGAGVAGEVTAPVVGAALPVWANAEVVTPEIVNPKIRDKTAIARKERRNLLVIVSLKLLGTLFRSIWFRRISGK
jgi:hypothetical protein